MRHERKIWPNALALERKRREVGLAFISAQLHRATFAGDVAGVEIWTAASRRFERLNRTLTFENKPGRERGEGF